MGVIGNQGSGNAFTIKRIQTDLAGGAGDVVVYTAGADSYAWLIQIEVRNVVSPLNLQVRRTHVRGDGAFRAETFSNVTGAADTALAALAETIDYYGQSGAPEAPATGALSLGAYDRLLTAGEHLRLTNQAPNTCQTMLILMEFKI